jgi:hypothetical protein
MDEVLVIVPETVIGWHRTGFHLSDGGPVRRLAEGQLELRVLIRRLAEENSNWDAPRIHGELLRLGTTV